jgi:hypothetical protein
MLRKLLIALALLAGGMPSMSARATPNVLTEEGSLNDSSGVPITNTVNLTFKIYDSATGGTELWSETQSVSVTAGYFSARLGLTTTARRATSA